MCLEKMEPLILIGPGTGIAPIRALVQQRLQQLLLNHYNSDTQSDSIKNNSSSLPKTIIFTGCRKKSQDFLYQKEWIDVMHIISDLESNLNHSKSSDICLIWNDTHYNDGSSMVNIEINKNNKFCINVIPAFSQDQDDKIYVTHKLKECGKLVCEALLEGGTVFVSGSAKRMPLDVKNAISEILVEHSSGNIPSLDEAKQFLQLLEKKKKYVADVWS